MATMTVVDSPALFSTPRFLDDLKNTSDAIGAPYSEPAISAVLKVFEECFKQGVVTWRATDRPGDALNFRIYLRRQLDTISIATEAGLLEPDNTMARLLNSWASLYNGETLQWIDFDPKKGLAKTWLNLKGRRPIDDILSAPEVPVSIRAHGSTFHSVGLEFVTFLAVDYHSHTMNLYFAAPSPIAKTQAAQYTNLVGCSPPTDQEFEDMLAFLSPGGYPFAVTMEYETGRITRVAIYAMNLTPQRLPTVEDRISKFLSEAPSYDRHQSINVAWSYGLGGSKYMKADSSYIGEQSVIMNEGPLHFKPAYLTKST